MPKEPTMTFAEVDALAEQLIREAAAQLPPGAELKKQYFKSLACEGANGIDTDKVFAERSYEVTHPATWPVDQVPDILKKYWKDRGYQIRRDDLDDPTIKGYYVRNHSNDMSVGFELYPRKDGTTDMIITSSSPCVKDPEE